MYCQGGGGVGREGAFQKYSLIAVAEQMELPDKALAPGFGVCPSQWEHSGCLDALDFTEFGCFLST